MLQIDLFIVLAQLINFWILFAIFKVFIAETFNAKMEQRKQQLKKLAQADEHYEQKMSLARQQKHEMLNETRQTTAALMRESEKIAIEKANIIIAKANRDATAILDGGRLEIDKERKSMLSDVKGHIVDMSLKLNEKMFGKWQTNREFFEKELSKMR